MLNRGALMLRYKEPALRWIVEADPSDQEFSVSLQDINEERNVYLIHGLIAEDPETVREWVELNFEPLFQNELSGWYQDETLWPTPLTIKLFHEWFDIECHSMVYDTFDGPIIDEDFEDDEIH